MDVRELFPDCTPVLLCAVSTFSVLFSSGGSRISQTVANSNLFLKYNYGDEIKIERWGSKSA